MNTIEEDAPSGRRGRRRHGREFKAQVVAACQYPCASVAAIALMHKLNANLLRRSFEQAEAGAAPRRTDIGTTEPSTAPCVSPAFVPLRLIDAQSHPTKIRAKYAVLKIDCRQLANIRLGAVRSPVARVPQLIRVDEAWLAVDSLGFPVRAVSVSLYLLYGTTQPEA